MSLDGYLDDLSARRLILSSEEDWARVRELRAQCDAILVGANTVRRDNPSLVIRDAASRVRREAAGMNPDIVKVTVSRSGNLDPRSKFFTEGAGQKIVFTCGPVSSELEHVADIVVAPEITPELMSTELERRGYNSLMVEGGASILAMFIRDGRFDAFRLAVAPFFVAQPGAPRLDMNLWETAAVAESHDVVSFGKNDRFFPRKVELLGDTTVIHLIPHKTNSHD